MNDSTVSWNRIEEYCRAEVTNSKVYDSKVYDSRVYLCIQ